MSVYESLDEQKKFACRVIADHARATAFSIADGILPANEGRNYVLRKIMRRAIYQGRHTLGFERLFFHNVTNFVVDQMGEAYPALEASRDFIRRMVKLEEERFGSTLTIGLQKLDELAADPEVINLLNQQRDPETVSSGLLSKKPFEDLLKKLVPLYDTYGVPRDLIRVWLEEQGVITFDEEIFNWHFEKELREIQSAIPKEERVHGKINQVYAEIARSLGAE